MLGHIKLECIGRSNAVFNGIPGFAIPNRNWVAEILGLGQKYKFDRKFLRSTIDYKDSNSKGSRGVYASYFPEHHKIHEVSSPRSWKNTDRYFCVFDKDGEHRLTEDEVIECLKSNH